MYKNVIWHSGYDGDEAVCLEDAKAATKAANLIGVDVMSWWCNKGGDSNVGIAYLGGLCSNYKINLNEKQDTAVQSAYVCINI